MTARLNRGASGQRQLRWALQVEATIRSHQKHNYLLTEPQQGSLADELERLVALTGTLYDAVTPYRAFIDSAFREVRADQRVADYLCDHAEQTAHGQLSIYRGDINDAYPGGFAALFVRMPLSRILHAGRQKTIATARTVASGIRTLPPAIPGTEALAGALDKAADLFQGFVNHEDQQIEPQRLPLRGAVRAAVGRLREGLDQMDGRLRTHFSRAFIESLYPELTKNRRRIIEDDDEDDDVALPE